MKIILFPILLVLIFLVFFLSENKSKPLAELDVYQYIQACKAELGIVRELPQLSCLDGQQIPIYVDKTEIQSDNWETLATQKKCDNPHWLGGDMGCWTYSHLQLIKLDSENIMVLNCRQKGNQLQKNWYRQTQTNLGMNQYQRKEMFDKANASQKTELYYLYNTFNDIGVIFRNLKTGKSCYLTEYGNAVAGFLPPLDKPLPSKAEFIKAVSPEQARPPKNFPQELWYRDANKAFRSPGFTADAGCIDCHNAHGFKYSPYINSDHGLPSIYAMSELPMLLVGKPFQDHFRKANFLQVDTAAIDGEKQLCTRCHNMTTSGTCGSSIDNVTGHPGSILHTWLTTSTNTNWMPPVIVDLSVQKKHIAVMKCCCSNPSSKGCLTRVFGPTLEDLPAHFSDEGGWNSGQEEGLCQGIIDSMQWNADKIQ